MTLWIPPDIAPICATASANLTQCSSMGQLYLTLITQLFGNTSYHSDPERENEVPDNFQFSDDIFQKNISLDDKSDRLGFEKLFDYIIIGAGSAGCVLANRLSEDEDQQILLLEAGIEEPDITMVPSFIAPLPNSNIDWKYGSQPDTTSCLAQKGQSCPILRGKAMGGSSAINYMVYMRGSKVDYDEWAADGNVGWSFKEVLPYFKKSENYSDDRPIDTEYHGTGGPLNVEKFSYVDKATEMFLYAASEKDLPVIDLSKDSQVGVDINLSTSKDGKRQSANVAFIKPIRNKRKNLKIVTNTFATKIIIDRHTKMALGVEFYKNGSCHRVYAKREVILSAGPINSPKLLKLSGIGPKMELETLNITVIADLKVGYNYQDHVTTDGLTILLSEKCAGISDKEQLFSEIYKYYNENETKSGPLATTATINSIIFMKTNQSKVNAPDIQIHFLGRIAKDYNADPSTYMATQIFPLAFYDSVGAHPLLLKPKSRGYVLLNQTDPVFDPPLIYPGFLKDQEDIDTLVEGIRFVVSLEDTEAFKRCGTSFNKEPIQGCTDYEWGTYNYFVCIVTHHTGTIFHASGTCKMGPPNDTDAVVDPRFNVYGIKRLRVVDSSTIPKIVRGNLNAPTIMMAEKASDMIKQDRKTL